MEVSVHKRDAERFDTKEHAGPSAAEKLTPSRRAPPLRSRRGHRHRTGARHPLCPRPLCQTLIGLSGEFLGKGGAASESRLVASPVAGGINYFVLYTSPKTWVNFSENSSYRKKVKSCRPRLCSLPPDSLKQTSGRSWPPWPVPTSRGRGRRSTGVGGQGTPSRLQRRKGSDKEEMVT